MVAMVNVYPQFPVACLSFAHALYQRPSIHRQLKGEKVDKRLLTVYIGTSG